MGSFDNAQSLKINNKYVRKITDSDDGVLFEANTQNVSRKFTKDISGGSSVTLAIEDTASVKKIKGNTVVWNQFLRLQIGYIEGGTATIHDTTCDFAVNTTEAGTFYDKRFVLFANTNPSQGHKILFSATFNAEHSTTFRLGCGITVSNVLPGAIILNAGTELLHEQIFTMPDRSETTNIWQFSFDCRTSQDEEWLNGGTITVDSPMLFDLTEMFGEGNEPSTVEEFRTMFPNEYYAFSEPTLLSFVGNGIKSYDSSKNVVGSCAIPTSTYFPDGMKSAVTVYDELLPNKAIKRIGALDLGTMTWVKYIPSDNKAVFRCSGFLPKPKYCGKLANTKYYWMSGEFVSETLSDGQIAVTDSQAVPILRIKDSSFNESTAAEFKSAMSGVMLYYELAEPVETPINPPLDLSYIVKRGGSEELESTELSSPIDANIEYVIT